MESEHDIKIYFEKAEELINRLDRLDVIYLRVSTKLLGQDEKDQLKDILNTFDLKLEDCLLIQAKESAFQLWAQKNRKLNIISQLFDKFDEEDKILYVWDLDRIYRNQELTVDFFRYIGKKNGIVISFRQEFLHKLKEMGGGFGRAMYHFMIEVYGYLAEDESKKRGDRLKKSLTAKNGRLYTNKNNLYGAKLKSTSGKLIKDVKKIIIIEKYVFSLVNKNIPYLRIVDMLAEKNVKISTGYITNVKKRLKE